MQSKYKAYTLNTIIFIEIKENLHYLEQKIVFLFLTKVISVVAILFYFSDGKTENL